MAQFKAFSPKVEVNGETVHAIVDGMGAFKAKALALLTEHGIPDPKPSAWYSQQAWLDAFKAIATSIGPATLFAIGQKIPANAKFPPGLDSIEKALTSVDRAYRANHRGGDIGSYRAEECGPKSVKMVCENPYPCEFDHGLVTAVAQRFKPAGTIVVKVNHDPKAPCRKHGADSCTYLVSW
ncbi:MAG TPA: hypothetical protein VLV17_09715 [Anaeromyxobacteraceae bacterium]|nr:hypothetical protein [Anaeromyxobacteraceae bacterium]